MKRICAGVLCLLLVLLTAASCAAPSAESVSQTEAQPQTQTPVPVPPSATEAPVQTAFPLPVVDGSGTVEPQWRYIDDPYSLDRITDDSWTLPGYEDSIWLTGSGSFGAYKGCLDEIEDSETPDVCLRQYLPDGKNVPVYYFRMSFTPEILRAGLYKSTVSYDDAVIIYLNGQPVFYGNTPEEGYAPEAPYGCAHTHGSLPEETFYLDASALLPGENVLAVELHQYDENSSDIYFRMDPLVPCVEEVAETRDFSVCLGVGENEDQMLVTWQGRGEQGHVELAEALAPNGGFPDHARVFEAERVYGENVGMGTFRAVLTELKAGQSYFYRVVDAAPSDTFSFSVPETGDFSFFVNGDPQIDDAEDPAPMQTYDRLLDQAAGDREAAFILSLGDQSDTADRDELFLRYLSAQRVKKTPVAALVGNHEDGSDLFSRYFYLPNMDADTVDSSGDMSGDYWFFRGNTLFLCINSNNSDIQAHETALKKAKEACVARFGAPKWIVAAFHHSIFSVGEHADSESTLTRRSAYTPIFRSLGVDVVFMGHDHSYVRTYPMAGDTPIFDDSRELTDPEGIVYFTLSSSTGTKFYEASADTPLYAAAVSGEKEPSITRVDVTDTTFTVTTFMQSGDALKVLDDLKIVKREGGGSGQASGDPLSSRSFGLFSWNAEVCGEAEADDLASVIRESGVSSIYQTFSEDGLAQGTAEEFVQRMTAEQVQVYALLGKAEWARESDGQTLVQEIQKIVDYNNAHQKAKIKGIMVDVEPHTLPEWVAGMDSQSTLLQSYVSGLKAAYDYCAQNGLELIACVSKDLDEAYAGSLEEIVAEGCDRLAVMNYDRQNEYGQMSAEVRLAKKYGKPVICIYELQKVGAHNLQDINTYANLGLDALWESAEQLQGQFAYDGLEFAYHYYAPLKEMLGK